MQLELFLHLVRRHLLLAFYNLFLEFVNFHLVFVNHFTHGLLDRALRRHCHIQGRHLLLFWVLQR